MATSLLLPDSSFYITCARQNIDPFTEIAARAADAELTTCGVVVAEVTRGRRDPHVLRRFQAAFAVMIYLPTTNAVWERVAQLAWSLDREGTVLQLPDLIIAATALEADATVLTFDAHFKKIPGLRVTDHPGPTSV
ncbi:MAG: PIN domain-containing protein [Opitutaceae bacterium]|nr:PIN domain-containing protein [Opitutaceae bacterium]